MQAAVAMLSTTPARTVGTGSPREVDIPRQGTLARRLGIRQCMGNLLGSLLRDVLQRRNHILPNRLSGEKRRTSHRPMQPCEVIPSLNFFKKYLGARSLIPYKVVL